MQIELTPDELKILLGAVLCAQHHQNLNRRQYDLLTAVEEKLVAVQVATESFARAQLRDAGTSAEHCLTELIGVAS